MNSVNGKALRIGLRRGWVEHLHLVKDRKELMTTLIGTGVILGGSRRLPLAGAVLTAWAVAGMPLAPWLIRRVTRRESGSRLAERQLAAQGS
jgi:hypothetical protein